MRWLRCPPNQLPATLSLVLSHLDYCLSIFSPPFIHSHLSPHLSIHTPSNLFIYPSLYSAHSPGYPFIYPLFTLLSIYDPSISSSTFPSFNKSISSFIYPLPTYLFIINSSTYPVVCPCILPIHLNTHSFIHPSLLPPSSVHSSNYISTHSFIIPSSFPLFLTSLPTHPSSIHPIHIHPSVHISS